MAIQYTSEEKKYVLLKGNILKRMEAERVSDAQMATATGMAVQFLLYSLLSVLGRYRRI